MSVLLRCLWFALVVAILQFSCSVVQCLFFVNLLCVQSIFIVLCLGSAELLQLFCVFVNAVFVFVVVFDC